MSHVLAIGHNYNAHYMCIYNVNDTLIIVIGLPVLNI